MAYAASGMTSKYQANPYNTSPSGMDQASMRGGGKSWGPNQNFTPSYANTVSNKGVYSYTPPSSGSVLGLTTTPTTTGRSTAPGSTAPTPTNGPSQNDLMSEIDGVYSDSSNYLNQVEGQLNKDLPSVLAEAEAQYQTNLSQLQGSRTSSLNQIQSSQDKATGTRDNALAEARRLYDELQRGYSQRFGGSSSAGQAASEIGSVEQQRQMGTVNRDYRQTLQQIESQRTELENNYQTQLLSMEQNKQVAINQANRDFQNKLLEINKMRAEIGQNKAQMRLQALQELRAQAFQIETENRQFQQQLEAQRQAAQLSLQQYAQQATQGVGAAQSSVDQFGNIQYNPSMNMQVQDQYSPYQNPLVGQVGGYGRSSKDKEQNFSSMYAN